MQEVKEMTSTILDGVFQAAAEQNKPEPGDYIGKDGLIYCGKCNTPKQAKALFFGEEVTAFCMCRCKTEAFEAEKAKERQREREMEIERNRSTAFPPYSNYSNAKFDNADMSKQLKQCQRYCVVYPEHYADSGKGLLLYGDTGAGKSFAAACIANYWLDKGLRVIYTTVSRIANKLQSSFEGRNEYLDELNAVSLLVIDDIRAERHTEFMNETLFSVIDGRTNAHKPLIVTTNVDIMQEERDITEQRIMSRLRGACIPIRFDGQDRRCERFCRTFEEDMRILGG